MTLRTLSFAGAFVFAAALVAQAADITGKWTAQVPGREGQTRETTYTFKVDGEKLTGTADAERMGEKQAQVALADGVVKGDQIAFTEPLTFDGNQIAITYTGVVGGDEIKFTRKVGDFATETFVAKRKKD